MNILLFGISNVGKSLTGSLLASRLHFDFYDLDEEVKKEFRITLEEFVSTGTLFERDYIRCTIINSLVSIPTNKVIAVTPLSYIAPIQHLFTRKDVFPIELLDSVDNIFDRLVFSDETDNIYTDNAYKNKHKKYYLNDIQEDMNWYSNVYSSIKHKFDMDGRTPACVTDALIQTYQLDSLMGV